MKILTILFFMGIGSFVNKANSASMDVKLYKKFNRNKMYYSTYHYIKLLYTKYPKLKLEPEEFYDVIRNIHPSIIKNDKHLANISGNIQLFSYIKGLRAFFLKEWDLAETYLNRVPLKDPMYAERSFLLSNINYKNNKLTKSINELKRCYRYAGDINSKILNKSVYPESLQNRCLLFLSRIYFEKKKFKKSLYFQNKMKKTQTIWPYIILEKAWNHYWMGNHSLVLGSLMTYNNPLLKRFMWPEAYYLRALSYYDLCYFEKSEKIYKSFDDEIYNLSKSLDQYSGNDLLRMMSLKEIPTKKTDSFVYYFLKSLKKDSKHSLFIHNLRQISVEINYFTKRKKNKVYLELADILRRQKLILIKDYENYLSYILRRYKNEILNVKKYFTKLRLTLGVKKRKHFIKSNKTKFEDKFDELSLSKIEGTKNKFIWEFKGGFWADELGDYAIAIENKCENKKN